VAVAHDQINTEVVALIRDSTEVTNGAPDTVTADEIITG
jgi:hypothetical protein